MTGPIEQCYQQSDDISTINSTTNMNNFLLSSFEAVSSISLNLTIINCHRRSQSLVPDVYTDSSTILCYLRQLLYRVPVERSLCNPILTLPTNLSENNLLPFTCKNIHRAITLYREMENKLKKLWDAETAFLC
ncbi:uncharacterized protein LOC143070806 [Mytilus galloprovincialis]|uniref:uncharacterized protein LOC143070806 n=1 Tax=Mytilus galloprovincialis TaxID=29158 RepID=UPI003F7C678D